MEGQVVQQPLVGMRCRPPVERSYVPSTRSLLSPFLHFLEVTLIFQFFYTTYLLMVDYSIQINLNTEITLYKDISDDIRRDIEFTSCIFHIKQPAVVIISGLEQRAHCTINKQTIVIRMRWGDLVRSREIGSNTLFREILMKMCKTCQFYKIL